MISSKLQAKWTTQETKRKKMLKAKEVEEKKE